MFSPGTYNPPVSGMGKQVTSDKKSAGQALLLGKCLVEPRFAGARSGGDRLGHLDFLDLDHQLRRIRGAEWEKQARHRGGFTSMGKQARSTQRTASSYGFQGAHRFGTGGRVGSSRLAGVVDDSVPGPGAYTSDSHLNF